MQRELDKCEWERKQGREAKEEEEENRVEGSKVPWQSKKLGADEVHGVMGF